MSVTFRLVCRGLSSPRISNRLNGLAGIFSSGHITGGIDVNKKAPHRKLHQSLPFCPGSGNTSHGLNSLIGNTNHGLNSLIGNTSHGLNSLIGNTSRGLNSLISTNSIFRHYSSQPVENNSLGQLVYKGRVSKMFKMLKLFSLTTSAIGLSVQPYIWITFQDLSIGAAIPLFAVLNSFVFVNPFLIHYISKKYITDLYFNSDTNVFTAYVLTFFARRETITFVAADVEVPDIPNMFAMLTVKGRPFFVQEDDFNNIKVYKHLMGFDRPLDLTYLQEAGKDDERKLT